MKSIKQFFAYMNDISFKYVVLRNWDNLPDSIELGEHSDLDLLVYDIGHWMEVFPSAERVYEHPRVQFKVPIGDSYIQVDVRYIGDRYYPSKFENEVLNTRVLNENGFYTPDQIRFRTALVYHAVHHKNKNSYKEYIGDSTVSEMLEALKESGIGYVEPLDPSVGRYNQYFIGATSIVEKNDGKVTKRQTEYDDFSLIDNEATILGMFDSENFPKVIEKNGNSIGIEYCGSNISAANLPNDWKRQIAKIVVELRNNKVSHNDIKLDNLLVKDGIIKLIDFGWASMQGDDISHYPSCLGIPNRSPKGPDDNYAMNKVVKQLIALEEENGGVK